MFENPIFPKAEKFVNPATVPSQKVLTIYSDDPRNNDMYKRTCGMTVVVIEKPNTQMDQSIINDSLLESEETDISTPFEEYSLSFFPQNLLQAVTLGAPQNLSIDPDNGFFTELSTTDGTVSFVATLNFDDVPGATSYEYSLVAL